MTKYINKTTKEYPVYEVHIKNRKHSFDDYAIVYNSEIPSHDPFTQVAVEVKPVLKDGNYFKQYEIRQLTEEGIEAYREKYNGKLKDTARSSIRQLKDFEDDLTDLKKVVQFMARGFAGLWASLPQDVKDANPYKDNFDLFSQAVSTTELRLDLETDQVAKIAKILQDEAEFASIVKDTYLDKVQ